MPFADRTQAGLLLAEALGEFKGRPAVILALPRGGVEVALPIAQTLSLPLDLLLVRKIGVPGQDELAMGAIVDGENPTIVRNEDVIALARISPATFKACADRALGEIERRREVYFAKGSQAEITGRIAIVVDDGIATGATLKAALLGLRKHKPAKIIVAVPVAPAGFRREIEALIDGYVCLEPLGGDGAVGSAYVRFEQLSDDDVLAMLDAARPDTRQQM